jgi:hypothetical protein
MWDWCIVENMAGLGGLEEFTKRPAVRRVALVLLVLGFGAILVSLFRQSPVPAEVQVRLDGRWPAVRSITLEYAGPDDPEPLRSVRWFPTSSRQAMLDTPHLTPGTYSLSVTVDTAEGAREYVRRLEHSRDATSRIDLRF